MVASTGINPSLYIDIYSIWYSCINMFFGFHVIHSESVCVSRSRFRLFQGNGWPNRFFLESDPDCKGTSKSCVQRFPLFLSLRDVLSIWFTYWNGFVQVIALSKLKEELLLPRSSILSFEKIYKSYFQVPYESLGVYVPFVALRSSRACSALKNQQDALTAWIRCKEHKMTISTQAFKHVSEIIR